MMTVRTVLAAAVAGVLTLGVVAGCAGATPPAEPTVADYLAEVRTSGGQMIAGMPDPELISLGQTVCADPTIMDAAKTGPGGEYATVAEKYCAPLSAAPPAVIDETDAGAPPSSAPRQVAIGEPFEIYNGQAPVATATITGIRTVTDCSAAERYVSEAPTPQRGTFIAVDMDVATTEYATTNDFGSIMAGDFSRIDPQGYETDVDAEHTAQWCEPGDAEFGLMTPGSKHRGTVVLDVDAADGSLVFMPRFLVGKFEGVTVPLQVS